MLPDSAAVDPYRSPALPAQEVPSGVQQGRPTVLTVICVLCIVLGALGLMNSLLGSAGAIAGPQLQKALQPKAGFPEQQKAQAEFQEEVAKVQGEYFTPIILSLAFRFIAALLLLIGGIRALGLREEGRQMLIAACVVALIFELGHAILQSLMMLEMMSALNLLAEGMVSAAPDGKKLPPQVARFVRGLMRGMFIAQFVLMYGLVLLKAVLYIFSYFYLRKPQIKALFTPRLAAEPL